MKHDTLEELTRMASIATSLNDMTPTVNKMEGLDLTPEQWFSIYEKKGPVRDAVQAGWERLWATGYCCENNKSMIPWR